MKKVMCMTIPLLGFLTLLYTVHYDDLPRELSFLAGCWLGAWAVWYYGYIGRK